MQNVASLPIDIAEIGLLSPTGDQEFERFADQMRVRFDADVALVTFIDPANGRQVLKGVSTEDPDWPQGRSTPLSQSLCKLVAAHAEPLAVNDVEAEIPRSISSAYLHLGVLSYLGTPLFAQDGQAIGALCLIMTTGVRRWRRTDLTDLTLFAETLNAIIAHRQTARKLDHADVALAAANAASGESGALLEELQHSLPGATLRYALFDDGTEAVEYLCDSNEEIWGYSEAELKGDPGLLWAAILGEDRERTRASVMQSAKAMSFWRTDFRIRRPDGTLRRLRGYAQPARMDHDLGVVWNTLILDLDRIEEDGMQMTLEAQARIAAP